MSIAPAYSLITALLLSTAAYASEKHVHGEAELFIVIENNQVLIELESPAANILGFEHQPATAEDEQVLQRSLLILNDYTRLINLNAGACVQTNSDLESPFEEENHTDEEHKHTDEEHGHADDVPDHADENEHSDFHVRYELTCENLEAIKTAEITAFDSFSSIETIDVRWVNATGQASTEVSKDSNIVVFNPQ